MSCKVKMLAFSVLTLLLISGLLLSSCTTETVQASKLPDELVGKVFVPAAISNDINPSMMAYFAKYDGIDGESNDAGHNNWIEIQSIDWGAQKSISGVSGISRRRAAVDIEDLVITMAYEKASIKLQEKCLKGVVIPRLQIELTTMFETRETYLKYDLTNVMVTGFDFSGSIESGGLPLLTVANNFEEVKVTYTEFDEAGNPMGNIEFEYKVEAGR